MPGGNPMTAFARLAGVGRHSADPVPEMTGFDLAEGRRLAAAEAAELLGFYNEGFPAATARLTAELGPDVSAAEGIEAFVAQAGLAPGQARRARQMLYGSIEAESAGLAESQSLRWMWNEREYDGNYFGDVPDGGYRRLTAAMAAGVNLRLGTEVTDVEVAVDGVRVRIADGGSEAGSHVVVTVPLGVLKRASTRSAPGRCWSSSSCTVTPSGCWAWTGRPCPEPTAVAVTSWGTDPYSRGSYSHISPGSSPADADLLGEPVGGRLLFAGEHTQSARLAYADGALTSGIREAKRLLGQPSVRLGAAGS